MAENDDVQERSEKATQKRLREARERGEVPQSRDFTAAVVTGIIVAAMVFDRAHISAGFETLMRHGMEIPRGQLVTTSSMLWRLREMLVAGFLLVTPAILMGMVAAVLTPAVLGGLSFSTEAFGVKLDRLNPLSGLGRIFSSRGLVELLKALLKFVFGGGVTVLLVWQAVPVLLAIGSQPVATGLGQAWDLITHASMVLAGTLVLLGAADVPWQFYEFAKRMRMTREEMKDEFKETEGRPEVKSRIRQIQQQAARKRMMQEVPRADVVVTNPSHYAVALKYEEGRMSAPQVVAKGVDLMALQMRTIATDNEVPILEAPPLARALYASTRLGDEVPAALYMAVAQVLTWVYRLRTASVNGAEPPPPPQPEVDPSLDPNTTE